jgi:uncharacterized MnhB-related membrane protein
VTVLQVAALVLVAAGGTAVALTRDPLRQAMLAGISGLFLAILFYVFQAPDVALSQLTVGTVALPLLILVTLAKLRHIVESEAEGEQEGEAEGEAQGESHEEAQEGGG